MRLGKPAVRSNVSITSGAGLSSSASTLGRHAEVFFDGVIRWGQISPIELALLSVRLSECDRQLGFGELFAEVEGVRVLGHAELVENFLDVGASDKFLGVEHRDRVAIREDAKVRVGDRRL